MQTSRRRFLQTSAAGLFAFPAILRSANPNGQLRIAVVGAAGQGLSDLTQTGSHQKASFAGFCDVDTSRFANAAEKHPGVPQFHDYREMFAKLDGQIDAVIVSIPDHMHAAVALDAMRRGKHVYCQKPLTHTVWEARQMRLQAEKSKVVTQMGNQIHSASEYRTGVKLLREGAIGKIKEVHAWQPNHGNNYTRLTAAPPGGPLPPSLHWELWIGTAPMREYAPDVYHPFKWRDWQDFGSGTLGDFGCHILDPIFTALELKAPLTVRAENDGSNAQTWPNSETIHYLFPGTTFTAEKTVPLTWYDGGRKPELPLAQMPDGKKLPGGGTLTIGENGAMVLPHVGMPQFYPEERFASFDIKKEAGANHYHLWVDAILAGSNTRDGFDYAGPLTEAVQLGNVATRVPGKELKWDAAELRIPNAPEAERLLTKEYREGWKIAAV